MNLREKISPNDIKCKDVDHYYATFGKCEDEIVGRNIVFICQKEGDWINFNLDKYKSLIEHDYTYGEIDALSRLAENGHLDCNDGVYSVTNSFIATLHKYYA